MKKTYRLNIWAQIVTLPFVIIMILLLLGTVSDYDKTEARLDKSSVEQTIEKYVVQCYASEGSYPPDLAYLTEHYGLILDEDRYNYEYDVFASNIMPDIIVTEKE